MSRGPENGEEIARIELLRAYQSIRLVRMGYVGFAFVSLLFIGMFVLIAWRGKFTDPKGYIIVGSLGFMTILSILGAIFVMSNPRFWSFLIALIWTLLGIAALPTGILFSLLNLIAYTFCAIALWTAAGLIRRIGFYLERYPDLSISRRIRKECL